MIHHIGVFASDFPTSKAFYTAALRPLAVTANYETDDISEYWSQDDDTPSLSLERATDQPTRGLHIAFAAPDRETVDGFFVAAMAAGGRERHKPRHWAEYRAYCAFVTDPDGNNVEAIHKEIPTPSDAMGTP
jgi:catechol 2,3-dioxygenase-like lactoylglutathione lyase family enzyme